MVLQHYFIVLWFVFLEPTFKKVDFGMVRKALYVLFMREFISLLPLVKSWKIDGVTIKKYYNYAIYSKEQLFSFWIYS